jgi:hypothetical protein
MDNQKDDTNWTQVDVWIRQRGLWPAQAYARSLVGRLSGRVDKLEQQASHFPVTIIFQFNGMRRNVNLSFSSSLDAPRRDEVVEVQFDDFGSKKRVTGKVEFAIYSYFQANTVQGVNKDGHILKIYLEGVTEQPNTDDIEEKYQQEYANVPTLEEYEALALEKNIKK